MQPAPSVWVDYFLEPLLDPSSDRSLRPRPLAAFPGCFAEVRNDWFS